MRRSRIRTFSIAVVSLVLTAFVSGSGTASAATTTVTATADAYVNRSAPTTNYGTSCCLASGGGAPYVAYMRFVVPSGATAATLALTTSTQTFAGSTSTFTLTEAADTWTEPGLTYNNRPANTGAAQATFVGRSANGALNVPLGNVASLAGRRVTLAVTGGSDDLWWWSHEHGAAAAPRLLVTTGGTPTPTPSPTATPTTTPTTTPTPTIAPTPTTTPTTVPPSNPPPTTPPPSTATIGVLGDSIAQGCCSSAKTSGFQAVASPFWRVTQRLLGWSDPTVDAQGGTGYLTGGPQAGALPFTARIGPLLDGDPSMQALVVEGGGNDPTSDPAALNSAVNATFDTIVSKAPTLRVYVLGPYSPNGSGYGVQTAIISQAAANHGFLYVDQVGETWTKGRGDLLWSDGFHPNEGGHDLLGRRLAGDLAIAACKGCFP